MRPHSSSLARSLFASYLLILLLAGLADAQTAQFMPVQPRITRAVDEAQLATLKGNTHPLARAQFDRGAAAPTLALERMLLVLKRSPEQEAALITLLDQQGTHRHRVLRHGRHGRGSLSHPDPPLRCQRRIALGQRQ